MTKVSLNIFSQALGKPCIARRSSMQARVSTVTQKNDLTNQVEIAKNFCIARGWRSDGVYEEVASALELDTREEV